MWEGWTKNLAALFPNPLWLATARTVEFVVLLGGVLASVALAPLFPGVAILLAATAATWLNFSRRIRRAHFSWEANLAVVAGLPIFALLLVNSFIHYKLRRSVTWKGRSYSIPEEEGSSRRETAHERHGLSDA
jgi:hypothetical protein